MSKALRRSSVAGELGAEDAGVDWMPVSGVVVEGGPIEPLLALRCRDGEEIAVLMAKGAAISCIGESKVVDGGSVDELLYLGVNESLDCEETKPASRVGNV